MEVDIHIYLKTLRDFFKKNPQAQDGLLSKFPGVEFDMFMVEVERVALSNYNEYGDPTISKKQILDMLEILHAQIMRDGLHLLSENEDIIIEKGEDGVPKIVFTQKFREELQSLKVFQPSTTGPICLN